MMDPSHASHHIRSVASFQELVSTPFKGEVNAMCWARKLAGDFSEIATAIALEGPMMALDRDELLELQLSEQGQLARGVILNDLELLTAHGASPTLNLIDHYERDEAYPFFPTDVYSFHVDRSPVPTDTFLCTYYGEPSELVPNSQAEQKVLIPEIRAGLRKLYRGPDEGFDSFLSAHFFDLHYQARPHARPISLGLGHVWRLAVDHPQSQVPPCIHRAPTEKNGQRRLLLIC